MAFVKLVQHQVGLMALQVACMLFFVCHGNPFKGIHLLQKEIIPFERTVFFRSTVFLLCS